MQAWLCEEPHDNAVSSSMEIAVGPRRVEASSQTAAPRVSVDAGTQTDSSSTTSPPGMPLTLARAPGWADVPLKAPPPVPPRHVEAPEVPQGDVPQPWKAPPHVRSASEEAGDPCTPAAISEHHHHHHHHTTTNVVSDVELVNGRFWAHYTGLTLADRLAGWVTLYAPNFQQIYFANRITWTSQWYPPNTDESSTGGPS